MLEKRREAQKKELDDKRKQIAEQNTSNVGSINTKFASRKDFKEDKLKQATFGVVTYDEFMARQETLEAGEDVGITNAPTKYVPFISPSLS